MHTTLTYYFDIPYILWHSIHTLALHTHLSRSDQNSDFAHRLAYAPLSSYRHTHAHTHTSAQAHTHTFTHTHLHTDTHTHTNTHTDTHTRAHTHLVYRTGQPCVPARHSTQKLDLLTCSVCEHLGKQLGHELRSPTFTDLLSPPVLNHLCVCV